MTAHLPASDAAVECLAQRTSTLQGHVNLKGIELQATVYGKGGFYHPHLDAGLGTANGSNAKAITFRTSTIFGILEADCDRCGTEFPNLFVNVSRYDPEWCQFVECGEDVTTLITKAVKGSAVFWRNRFNDGGVDHRLLHAGLPLQNGTKFGLNIWTSVKGPPLISD